MTKQERFQNFKLYAVTDVKSESSDILERVEAAYRGGADIIQLRSKILRDGGLYRLGLKMRAIADRHEKLFFVNDRVDLALATGSDGVHLGQEDLPVAEARRLAQDCGRELLIGKSTHSLEQALAAQAEGPDYIGVGPIFGTPTKPDYAPVGLDLIRRVRQAVRLPFVAIGGIDLNNIDQVLEAGAGRVAVVRAVFAAGDPEQSARRLHEHLTCSHRHCGH